MFGDGEHILYVYGEYRDDSDIGKLMHERFQFLNVKNIGHQTCSAAELRNFWSTPLFAGINNQR